MPVLVTGATGVIGRALIPRLVQTGGQVRVYVRRDVPEYRALGAKVATGDADHEGRLESALEQVHTLVHLVGGPLPERGVTVEWLNVETTLVALRAAENAEVRRILFLSPLGAEPGSSNAYLDAKGRAEQAISGSKLEHAIFRCAPVLGPGSTFEAFLARGVPARARDVRVNPIAADDVVRVLVAADTRDAEVRGTWELGGPETRTLGELAAKQASIVSRPPRELADLYARDAVADVSAAVAQFGVKLQSVEPPG